jgi:hypothetical protein
LIRPEWNYLPPIALLSHDFTMIRTVIHERPRISGLFKKAYLVEVRINKNKRDRKGQKKVWKQTINLLQ